MGIRKVVNCFRTCIFVILKTTEAKTEAEEVLLWIAFELVSSSYWKQLHTQKCRKRLSCELLSNLYLRHIENNTFAAYICTGRVVNCFRTCIFVILKTTAKKLMITSIMLWIAFELVSSSYWKQRVKQKQNDMKVVNCFRTCIFVILKTTKTLFWGRKWELWIAFELVSSSYWKQQLRTKMLNAVSCELLSNLYLRHIENNEGRISVIQG